MATSLATASGSSEQHDDAVTTVVRLLTCLSSSITVAEMNETSSDESLASSLVIMPHAIQQTVSGHTTEGARFSTSSITIPSAPSSIGGSSISLLDAVSSTSSDDDDAMYEDSRSQEVPTPEAPVQDAEYVMLFDSSSSEDD